MNVFSLDLDGAEEKYLYEKIYAHIVREIREGKLIYEEKLPSTRSQAEYLGISRSTVELAYEQLVSEGYIESRPNRGYFVCRIEELYHLTSPSRQKEEKKEKDQFILPYDFSPYGIDLEEFPVTVWKRIQKSILNEEKKELFARGDAQGEYVLRESICKYLRAARGVSCAPQQVVIGAGNDYLLMLLLKMMGENCVTAIENPTYLRAYQIFCSFGHQVRTISMDEYGMNPKELWESGASLAYLMPSHQFPTGIVMPIGRRMELLKWAGEKEGRFLIEDDYDSEFRYRGRPVPSLMASDHKDKVIYLGTFSKSIAPAIRISYMVLPNCLLTSYQKSCAFLSSTVSRIDQIVLHEFMKQGFYERHLNKMRRIYKNKHDLLLHELKELGNGYGISGENAGLHLVLSCHRKAVTEELLIQSAAGMGVKIYGLSEFLSGVYDGPPTVILGYATMEEEKLSEGIRRLKRVLMKDTYS